MNKKKLVSLVVCGAMAVSMLAGCGQTNTPSSNTSSSAPSASASSQAPAEPVGFLDSTPAAYSLPLVNEPITLSISITESWTPEYGLADNREIFQELEKKTGVKLDWQVVPGKDYNTVIGTRIAGGDLPDMMGINSGINPIELYEDGLTINHTEYISKFAPNILDKIKNVPGVKGLMMGPDGEAYCATVDVREQRANVKGLYYRKDWQLALGIPDPVTTEDYFNMFKAFATQDPNGNGKNDEIAMHSKGINDFSPLILAFGIHLETDAGADLGFSVDANGKVGYEFAKPEMKDALAYIKSYYDAGIIPKEAYGDQATEKTLLANNRLGAYFNGVGQCDTYDKVILQAGFISEVTPTTGYSVLIPPTQKDGNRYFPNRQNVADTRFVISAKSKNPEAAIKWLDYVWATEEGSRYTTLGIEGKSYNMVDGKPVLTDYILKNPDGIGVHPALRTLGSFTPWITYWTDAAFGAQWANNEKMSGIIKTAEPLYGQLKGFPKMLGSPEDVSAIASKMSDVSTYLNEMLIKFIMGQESLDNFDKFVETMNNMGLKEVLEIKQRQYDAFVGK